MLTAKTETSVTVASSRVTVKRAEDRDAADQQRQWRPRPRRRKMRISRISRIGSDSSSARAMSSLTWSLTSAKIAAVRRSGCRCRRWSRAGPGGH